LVIFLADFGALFGVPRTAGRDRADASVWLALMAVSPWIWWVYLAGQSGLTGWRGATALVVRLALVAALAMLLAEPRAVRKSDVLSVVYVLDVSDSMGEKASEAAGGT